MKVVFLHRVTCDYSKSFLEKLHFSLQESKIEFNVISGQPWSKEGLIDIVDDLPFGKRCKNIQVFKSIYFTNNLFKHLKNADLIIVEQLGGYLPIYFFLLFRWFDILKSKILKTNRKTLFAYYGHGTTLNNTKISKILGPIKKAISTKVDWWFAYTEFSAAIIKNTGFSKNRITVFQNATDTKELKNTQACITLQQTESLIENLFNNKQLNTSNSKEEIFTAVFVSRFIPSKQIPFLLKSLEIVLETVGSFRIIFIGDGPDAELISSFCKQYNGAVWVGSKHGTEKVAYISIADFWLNPGPAGLSIVDSFALGVPFITTNTDGHGPEIDYLQHNKNSLVLPFDEVEYANGIIELCLNKELLKQLKANAKRDGEKYTTDEMASRLHDGVISCLEIEKLIEVSKQN